MDGRLRLMQSGPRTSEISSRPVWKNQDRRRLLITIIASLSLAALAGCFNRTQPAGPVPYGNVADYMSYANTDDFGPLPYYSPIDWLWYPEPFGIYQDYGWYPYYLGYGDRDCDDGYCGGGRRRPNPLGHPPPPPTSPLRFEMADHSGASLGEEHAFMGGFHGGFGGFHGGGGHR